uniref:C-type lectin domain-containing protein n=1 Tax=Stomoxys calcitrans TaxID=35570 RepID=A0A1I8NST3_STOCA
MSTLRLLALCVVLMATIFDCALSEPKRYRVVHTGSTFYIETEQKYNWFQALHECARRGYKLAELQDKQKTLDLELVMQSYLDKPFNLWLGANDEFNTKQDYKRSFYWSFSGKRMTYSNWSRDNPDNYKSNEHCVHIWTERERFAWNDLDCTKKLGYVCEDKPSKASS